MPIVIGNNFTIIKGLTPLFFFLHIKTAMNMARRTPFRFPAELLLLAYQEDMFTIHTVQEILWGYTDKFLKAIHKFFPGVDPVFGYFKQVKFLSPRVDWLPFLCLCF